MIVYCCQDLIFATKISSTAQVVGASVHSARNLTDLASQLGHIRDAPSSEGIGGIIIDLEFGATAVQMVHAAKEHDASIMVIAFGSHVATQILEAAKDAGADLVMPRSQFTAQLPALLKRIASGKGPNT